MTFKLGRLTTLTAPCTFHWQVTHIKTIKQEDELVEIQLDTGTWYRRWMVRFLNLSQQVSCPGWGLGAGGRVCGTAGFPSWEPCWATTPAGGGCNSTAASAKGFWARDHLPKDAREKPPKSLAPLAASQTWEAPSASPPLPQVWANFHQCFAPEYRRVTLMMMAVWFTMSFR